MKVKKSSHIANYRTRISKKRIVLTVISIIVFAIGLLLLSGCDTDERNYKNAQTLFNDGKYTEAVEIFRSLGYYKDSPELANTAAIVDIAKSTSMLSTAQMELVGMHSMLDSSIKIDEKALLSFLEGLLTFYDLAEIYVENHSIPQVCEYYDWTVIRIENNFQILFEKEKEFAKKHYEEWSSSVDAIKDIVS